MIFGSFKKYHKIIEIRSADKKL